MKFESKEAVRQHQSKFCSDGSYGNVMALGRKMQELQTEPLENARFGVKEVRELGLTEQVQQYLRGEKDQIDGMASGGLKMQEAQDHFRSQRALQYDKQDLQVQKDSTDYAEQVQRLKNRKHLDRMKNAETEKDEFELLKELERGKERELRAEIEREEIRRTLAELDRGALTNADKYKKRELEKLEAERSSLGVREQQMVDEIERMDREMKQKEKKFQSEANEARRQTNDDEFTVNEIRKKEVEMARERGSKVVALKHKRSQLEAERERILDDLEKIQQGQRTIDGRDPNHGRSNLKSAGLDIINPTDRAQIDPAMKDKLISDQARINHLQQQYLDGRNGKEVDALDKFLNTRGNEHVSAGPRSFEPPPKDYNIGRDPIQAFEGGTPIPKADATKIPNARDLQKLQDDYEDGGGNDPEFLKKVRELDDFVANKPMSKQEHYPRGSDRTEIQVNEGGAPVQNPLGIPQPFGNEIMPNAGGLPYGPQQVGQMPMQPPMQAPPPGAFSMAPPMGHPMQPIPGFRPQAQPDNQNLAYMENLVKEQERENSNLEGQLAELKKNDYSDSGTDFEALKRKLMGPGNGLAREDPFPDDFVWRQNDFRSEDLEVEERALLHLIAQEYDHLRVISRLPVNSELYRFKMDQYKQLSDTRSQIESVLQEQRVEKIKRDYEKSKFEDQRRMEHDKWLEEQKREILAAKLRDQNKGGGAPTTANYGSQAQNVPQQYPDKSDAIRGPREFMPQPGLGQPPVPQQIPTAQFPPSTAFPGPPGNEIGPSEYDPSNGFLIFFDVCSRVPREFKRMQIVYGGYNNGSPISDNRQLPLQDAEADPEETTLNRFVYDLGHQVKHVQPHPNSNLIIECQVPDADAGLVDGNQFRSYGWTILNLFDYTYGFHNGEFKLPLYAGQTLSELDTRDVNTLVPHEDKAFVCVRLGLPGDDISTSHYLPDRDTREYRVPSIHQVEFRPETPDTPPPDQTGQVPAAENPMLPPAPPGRANVAEGTKKPKRRDPFYQCSGLKVHVHHVTNFAGQKGQLRIGANLMEENHQLSYGPTEAPILCSWISNPVDVSKVQLARWKDGTGVNPAGAPILGAHGQERDDAYYQNVPGYEERQEATRVPITSEVVWPYDFYKHQWDRKLKKDLFLAITLRECSSADPYTAVGRDYPIVGYGTLKVNQVDGTLRYGTYDLEVYESPVKIRNHDSDKKTKTTITVTLAPHVPKAPAPPVHVPEPLKPVEPELAPSPPPKPAAAAPAPAPYLENAAPQGDREPFVPGDGVDFYLDAARYLPDNVTFTRCSVHGYLSNGKKFLEPLFVNPDMRSSAARSPRYDLVNEVRQEDFNPTSFLIFTLDTYDSVNRRPGIVGHAVLPLFLGGKNRAPVTDPNLKDFYLHKGAFQLPIYSSFPRITDDFGVADFELLDKIPCATLLVRIRKPKQDDGGAGARGVGDVGSLEEAKQLGLFELPPNYKDNVYSTRTTQTSQRESAVIYAAKAGRPDTTLKAIVAQVANSQTGWHGGMDHKRLARFCEERLLAPPVRDLRKLREAPTLDLRYFSEYLPELGFRVAVDFLHLMKTRGPRYVVMSTVPPGHRFLSKAPGAPRSNNDFSLSADLHHASRFDAGSSQRAMKFSHPPFEYRVAVPELRHTLIFEVFKVQTRDGQVAGAKPDGFAVLPCFLSIDFDANADTLELYVNSGRFQLPLFKTPDESNWDWESFVREMPTEIDAAQYVETLVERGTLEPMPEASLIVRLVDNQLEGHFGDRDSDWDLVDQQYIPDEDRPAQQFSFEGDFLAGAQSGESLLPLGESSASYEASIASYLRAQFPKTF